MFYNSFPSGSEWRRWDLHVHTPASYLSTFGDDWDDYVKNLISAIKEHDVRAIATADYFTIDGYERLLSYYDVDSRTLKVGTESAEVTLIPGVELRLREFNGKEQSINLHYLFNPTLKPSFIRRDFLGRLSVKYRGKDLPFDETKILAIGRSIETGEAPDYLGEQNFSPEEKIKYRKKAFSIITLKEEDIGDATKNITEILKAYSKKECLFLSIVAGKGYGSIAYFKWYTENNELSRAGATRENLTGGAHLVFSNNPQDRDFFLGKRTDTSETEVEERFGSLKACVWGSDCHSKETLLHPSNGNTRDYTWIKADPTFEGLKQLLYEPADRVRIQDENPFRRSKYSIIKSVRFKGVKNGADFIDQAMQLNSNLNAIIGGKSSGKSILLYYIARTIDPEQVRQKFDLLKIKPYEFEKIAEFDFEVTWADDKIDKLSEGIEEKKHQITYIPQMYINHLAEVEGEDKRKELIEDILSQNTDYKNNKDQIETEIDKLVGKIGSNVTSFFQLRARYYEISNEIKNIGTKANIEVNITKLLELMDLLRKQSGFTVDDEKNYTRLETQIRHQESQHNRSINHAKLIDGHVVWLRDMKDEFSSNFDSNQEYLTSQLIDDPQAQNYLQRKIEDENNQLKAVFDKLIAARETEKSRIIVISKKRETMVSELQTQIEPFLSKIKNQKQVASLNEELGKERKRIALIDEKEKVRQGTIESANKIKTEIVSNYSSLMNQYRELVQLAAGKTIGDIKLNASLDFDLQGFDRSFSDLFNRRSTNFKNLFGDAFNDNNEYVFEESKHLSQVEKIFKIISKSQSGLTFKVTVEAQDVTYKLFDNFFKIKYSITQGDDDMLQMSPGKRGVVLLQLILHLSNATHPILIDQPEDNLDNRTIFKELNDFIKTKKQERQIIIVTHNANLVVSTDSEVVIVANQEGQEPHAENREFKFEYVSGSLENSFKNETASGILYQFGIRNHVCDILEGGEDAFKKREEKYGFN